MFLIFLDVGVYRDSDFSWIIVSCSAGLVFSRPGFILSPRHFLIDQIIASRLDGLVVCPRMFLVRLSDYIKDISKFQHTHEFHM